MTVIDLLALLPFIVVATASLVVMLGVAFYRNHTAVTILTLVGFAAAFATLPVVASLIPRQVTPLLILDRYALFYLGLIFFASFVVTILSHSYFAGQEDNHHEEFYMLLLLATLGAGVLVASNHFVSFFLGLEILSVALYSLIAYLRAGERSFEAGVKYLVLAATSAAFLLFGMALIYAERGTMEFAHLVLPQATNSDAHNVMLLAGLAMIVIGIGFKLAVVPFHMWTPDVYEGAPAPATAFIATVSKGAMFALLLRYFTPVNIQDYSSLWLGFALIAIASMLVGNLLALLQNNVKRILAYSSIAHLGYVLVAFQVGGTTAATAVTFYLVAYIVTTLGAFGIITVLSSPEREADTLEDYHALGWQRPWLAGIFTAMLLSLAGIPLTAGFIGKFYILAVGVESALWVLVVILVVSSALGLFYYLRIVVAMYRYPTEGERERGPAASSLSLAGGVVLAVLTVLLVWLGIYPVPFLEIIRTTMASLIS